jgi:hypothetical protein
MVGYTRDVTVFSTLRGDVGAMTRFDVQFVAPASLFVLSLLVVACSAGASEGRASAASGGKADLATAPPTAVSLATPTTDCPETTSLPATPADPPPEDFPALAWYRNPERTLWAGLAPAFPPGDRWYAGKWLKVRWWRRGALATAGRRLDGPSPLLEVTIDGQTQGTPPPLPTGSPTPPAWNRGGGAASGILIPTVGCWEITARMEWDELRFVVYAHPWPVG